jgi:flagellar hook-length control protein FliK
MSESIQITPSANAGVQQSKHSPLDSANNPESTDDSAGFTAVFASYVESETDASEQQAGQNLAELLNELLPQETLVDGNTLPEQDQAAMWQALMLLQPADSAISNSAANSMQSMNLLDNPRKPMLNSQLLNQNYFQNAGLQNKEFANTLPPGLATNNISAQLAAAHFMPEKNESILLNMSEQLMPAQATNSTLTPALAAVGLGTATQAAVTQTQMAPLNLGQNAWETNLGSRLQMMVGQNVQTAEIRLDPPELGALDIKIKITNDVASVNITSPHSQVREALETAVPRLREMFAESGVSLGDVNVGQESLAQQQNSSEEEGRNIGRMADSDFADEPVSVTRKIVSDNLLDMYA